MHLHYHRSSWLDCLASYAADAYLPEVALRLTDSRTPAAFERLHNYGSGTAPGSRREPGTRNPWETAGYGIRAAFVSVVPTRADG